MRQPASQPASERSLNRGARRRGLWIGAALTLGIVSSVAVWAANRGPVPEPGIRQATWRRTMDVGLPGSEQKSTKFYVRIARTYLGPPPTDEELERYRAAASLDAFQDYLREPFAAELNEALAEIGRALDVSGNAVDDAIAACKERVRGTENELVSDPEDPEASRARAQALLREASKAEEFCVSDWQGGRQHLYRMRRDVCADVHELRAQDEEINRARMRLIHDCISELLREHGRDVFDEARMREVWADVLERGSR